MVRVPVTSSEPAVQTAWGKTGSWCDVQAQCTHTHAYTRSRFCRSCSLLRSLTVQAPRFLLLQCVESGVAERGGADRHYRDLQAQSYLYSVYRFTLTHHGAGRSIRSAAAYHWMKKNPNQSFTDDSWL